MPTINNLPNQPYFSGYFSNARKQRTWHPVSQEELLAAPAIKINGDTPRTTTLSQVLAYIVAHPHEVIHHTPIKASRTIKMADEQLDQGWPNYNRMLKALKILQRMGWIEPHKFFYPLPSFITRPVHPVRIGKTYVATEAGRALVAEA